MGSEAKTGSGRLRRNPNKAPGEPGDDPDYVGECVIDREPLRIEAWIIKKEGEETYMSLRFFDASGGLAKAMLVRAKGLD
jgi:hypothetical protein